MLGVFFAKTGNIGLHDVEQFAHYGCHAAKMGGAGLATQLVLQRRRFNKIVLLACGIQLGFIGGENGGNARGAQLIGILCQRARIAVKILALPKLDAVHKNADYNVFRLLLGARHKGEMPVV